MSDIYVGEMQDEDGNTVYPHTEADVVFCSDGKNVQEKINNELLSGAKVLKTIEEIEANTNPENVAGATALKEVNNNLMFPDGTKFYPDIKDGKRGYNTDPARGADTFIPFNPVASDPNNSGRFLRYHVPDGQDSTQWVPGGAYFYYISDHGQAHSCYLPGSILRAEQIGNRASYQSYATFGTVIIPDSGGSMRMHSNNGAGGLFCVLYRLSD